MAPVVQIAAPSATAAASATVIFNRMKASLC
jgi:hypothetical protein